MQLACPTPFTVPWNSGARVDFGYSWLPGSEPIEAWSIEYGDGRSFTAATAEEAEANLFWHEYAEPGTYTAVFYVSDTESPAAASDDCTFTYTREPAPAPPQGGQYAPPPSSGAGGFNGGSSGWLGCHYNGIEMWGDVKVVEYGADITVKVVEYGEDLRVKLVDYGANSCGRWREADYGADFSIKFVEYGADISIKFVEYGEGR